MKAGSSETSVFINQPLGVTSLFTVTTMESTHIAWNTDVSQQSTKKITWHVRDITKVCKEDLRASLYGVLVGSLITNRPLGTLRRWKITLRTFLQSLLRWDIDLVQHPDLELVVLQFRYEGVGMMKWISRGLCSHNIPEFRWTSRIKQPESSVGHSTIKCEPKTSSSLRRRRRRL
jgi:hypothetical protein